MTSTVLQDLRLDCDWDFAPIPIPCSSPRLIIALGPELKSTICYLQDSTAWLSSPFGDLRDGAAYRRYRAVVHELLALSSPRKAVLAHDMHPSYISSQMLRETDLLRLTVQHHQAHAAGALAGAGHTGPAIAIVCDGTGYGTDGASWGGEVLFCESGQFTREAHLAYCALPGGDASAVEGWRPAISLLHSALGDRWRELNLPVLREVPDSLLRLIERMLVRDVNCPRSSSLGRLFDAVAAITGLCMANTRPAEAAIAVQQAASRYFERAASTSTEITRQISPVDVYDYELDVSRHPAEINLLPMIRQIAEDVAAGGNTDLIAARFHETVAAALAGAARATAERHGVGHVVMSGGCFLNGVLSSRLTERLDRHGLHPLSQSKVPIGDDGVSVGQAVVAAEQLKEAL